MMAQTIFFSQTISANAPSGVPTARRDRLSASLPIQRDKQPFTAASWAFSRQHAKLLPRVPGPQQGPQSRGRRTKRPFQRSFCPLKTSVMSAHFSAQRHSKYLLTDNIVALCCLHVFSMESKLDRGQDYYGRLFVLHVGSRTLKYFLFLLRVSKSDFDRHWSCLGQFKC